jgi:hypothetical protein
MSKSEIDNMVSTHYGRPDVQREIARYSQDRWVAVHCDFVNPQSYSVLLRYQRGDGKLKIPLTITKPEDVPSLLNRFARLKPRTFYASINVYRDLTHQESVRDLKNIAFCAPTWDIDNSPEKWESTIAAAKAVLGLLEEEGISKSIFVKWSGRGAHVHVHHRAFSQELIEKIGALNLAYAIVEYALRNLKARFREIAETSASPELSVENEIDIQRVFSCPLSLHRSLNRVVVCFAPSSVGSFNPEWTRVDGYRHWENWDQFEIGEGDVLAEKAYKKIGVYVMKTQPKPKLRPERKTSENSLTRWLQD